MPDNGIALERREAQGSSQGPARPGTPTTLKDLGPGNLARRLADRKAGLNGASQSSMAPPGAPSPLARGTEKGKCGPARAPEFKVPGWRSVG